jgi:hypothetical protein
VQFDLLELVVEVRGHAEGPPPARGRRRRRSARCSMRAVSRVWPSAWPSPSTAAACLRPRSGSCRRRAVRPARAAAGRRAPPSRPCSMSPEVVGVAAACTLMRYLPAVRGSMRKRLSSSLARHRAAPAVLAVGDGPHLGADERLAADVSRPRARPASPWTARSPACAAHPPRFRTPGGPRSLHEPRVRRAEVSDSLPACRRSSRTARARPCSPCGGCLPAAHLPVRAGRAVHHEVAGDRGGLPPAYCAPTSSSTLVRPAPRS